MILPLNGRYSHRCRSRHDQQQQHVSDERIQLKSTLGEMFIYRPVRSFVSLLLHCAKLDNRVTGELESRFFKFLWFSYDRFLWPAIIKLTVNQTLLDYLFGAVITTLNENLNSSRRNLINHLIVHYFIKNRLIYYILLLNILIKHFTLVQLDFLVLVPRSKYPKFEAV